MFAHILNCCLEPTVVAEANTQQAFVDILDNDVIGPLTTLKVSQEHLVQAGISVLIIGRSGRNRKMRRERRLRKISRNPPRGMQITQRTQSRSSSRHTWRNIGSILTLPAFLNILRKFRTKGFVVGGKNFWDLSLPSLKKVSPISSIGSDLVY